MKLNDEAGGQTRWDLGAKTLAQAREVAQGPRQRPGRQVLPVRQRAPRRPGRRRDRPRRQGDGRRPAMLDAVQRQAGTRVAAVVLLPTAPTTPGPRPLVVARRLRSQEVPGHHRRLRRPRTPGRSRATSPCATSSPARPSSSRTSSRCGGRSSSAASPTSGSTWRCSSRARTEPVAVQQVKVPAGGRGRPVHRPELPPPDAGREAGHGPGQAQGGGAGPDE